jgi:arylsulfatase A-like enzyme
MMGAQGVRPKTKQVPFGESANVPFLLRYPAVTGNIGRMVQMPINTIDIFPTLLGLAKLKVPKTCEGDDLSPLIIKNKEDLNRSVVYMNISPFTKTNFPLAYRAIKTKQYTYIRSIQGPWFLFDDLKDPFQMNNLLTNKSFDKLSKQLDSELYKILNKNGDSFQPGSFYISKWGYQTDASGAIPYSGDHLTQQTPRKVQ